ncbi:MAG: phosphatase PAP2 family protein [Chitinophagales bacterium]|nr:phosphatase PAP2 family protein [Chitinophagales bacterium]
MLETILQLDQELFFIVNGEWHVPWLDAIMPYWRDKKFWIPLYIVLSAFLFIKYRLKGLYFILAVALTVGVADTVSSKLLKKSVKRVRPCNDVEIQADVALLAGCGKGYSFTSSHATNHFAIALFIASSLGLIYWWARWPFIIWAGSIAFGQVYVGVHYPLDVICGAILGSLIGWSIALLYKKWDAISIPLPK